MVRREQEYLDIGALQLDTHISVPAATYSGCIGDTPKITLIHGLSFVLVIVALISVKLVFCVLVMSVA